MYVSPDFYLTNKFAVTVQIHSTYRTFKFCNSDRNSGTDPVKLLFDKSLNRHKCNYYDKK